MKGGFVLKFLYKVSRNWSINLTWQALWREIPAVVYVRKSSERTSIRGFSPATVARYPMIHGYTVQRRVISATIEDSRMRKGALPFTNICQGLTYCPFFCAHWEVPDNLLGASVLYDESNFKISTYSLLCFEKQCFRGSTNVYILL